MTKEVYKHLQKEELIPDEQKGCTRSSRASKDQLLIDCAILKEAKSRHKNLEMIWEDYAKAYDSVPHSWILECLSLFKVYPAVLKFMTIVMSMWKTELFLNNTSLGNVDIRRGIFQGDSFSPLLFIMSLIPLSVLLKRTSLGYKLSSGNVLISHLFYMDDLKLYARSLKEVQSLLNSVSIYSSDIKMSFCTTKCAHLGLKRGKQYSSDGITLPGGGMIKSLDDGNGYKYLGVHESCDILHNNMKQQMRQEYFRCLRLVLRSQLNSRNKFRAVNAYCLPIIRYTAGIVKWNVDDLRSMDRKTRKVLTMHRGLHPRSDVDRLYISRKKGGRGLKSVEDVVYEEKCSLFHYLSKSQEPLLIAVRVSSLISVSETKRDFIQHKQLERFTCYFEKALHGYFVRSRDRNFDEMASVFWLTKGDLSMETEGFLLAAQDQALRTRALQNVFSPSFSPQCRLCNSQGETVEHLVSGCTQLAGTQYKTRHDNVAKYLHWLLCGKYDIQREHYWWKHSPYSVVENNSVKILWDFNIFVDHVISARWPDIVVIDKVSSVVTLIDVSIPADKHLTVKEEEKLSKYQDLRIELERLWQKRTVMVPVVIGALGSITKRLHSFLGLLAIDSLNLYILQKTALLGTATILRKVLQLSGCG